MIRYARSCNIRPLVNTNGTTLNTGKNRKALLESGVEHITFAFDGYNAETYENIRIGADYQKVINGIKEFLLLKRKRGLKKPYITITTLEVGIENYRDKEEEKQKFLSFFDGFVDQFVIKQTNTWGSTFKGTDKYKHQELANIFHLIEKIFIGNMLAAKILNAIAF